MSPLLGIAVISGSIGYIIWFVDHNVRKLSKPLRYMAAGDGELLTSGKIKREHLQPTIGGFLTVQSAFASVTTAVLFLIVGMLASQQKPMTGLPLGLISLVIVLLVIATVCWLISLDQVSRMLSPSIPEKTFLALYREGMNLWNIGMVLLIGAMCFFLLLFSTEIASIAAVGTAFIAKRHLTIIHDW